ncbi:MAG: hypothetical protein KC589_06070 [Nanoarchaeota archaeon]|nr:hypothetical protein [Nanoarchaeota archaeon]
MLTLEEELARESHQKAVRKGINEFHNREYMEMNLAQGYRAIIAHFGSNEPIIRDALLIDLNLGDLQVFSIIENRQMYYIVKEIKENKNYF